MASAILRSFNIDYVNKEERLCRTQQQKTVHTEEIEMLCVLDFRIAANGKLQDITYSDH